MKLIEVHSRKTWLLILFFSFPALDMKALITVVCSLAVGLSYGAKIPFGDDSFGGDRDYNKTILRANGEFLNIFHDY